MKSKSKVLLSSIASIALCSSIAVGGTYALFTSESKVNIAVTSGKVNVVASLTTLQTWSLDETEARTDGSFANGGTATIAKDTVDVPTLTLDRMAPGDKATVTIQIDNNSTINVQYRVKIDVDGELAPALVASTSIEGTEYDLTQSSISPWFFVEAPNGAGTDINDLTVTVEFPDADDNNLYMNKSAEVNFMVEAVQSNGVANEVSTATQLKTALKSGGNVTLAEDIVLEEGNQLVIPADVSVNLDLNGKKIDGNNVKNSGALIANNGTLTITGGNVTNSTVNGDSVISNSGTLVLDGVNIVGAPMDSTGYPAYAVSTSGKLTVEDGTTISANRGAISMSNGADVVINGGRFTVSNAADGRNMTLHTVYAYGYDSKLTINDGYFEQGHTSTSGASVICPAGATIDIYGGDFRDAMDDSNWQSTGNFQNYMGYGVPVNVYGGTFDDKTFEKNLAKGCKVTDNGDGTYTVGVYSSDAALDEAIQAGATTVRLGSGNYIIPSSAQGKNLTIIGNGDTVILPTKIGSGGENVDYGLDGSTVTFENITITTNSSTYIGYARLNATYNNCTINGTYTLYGDSTFNNCTFNVSGDVYNIWTWGAPNATFKGCTFNSDGKALLLYGTADTNLTVENCVFNDNGGLTDLKAAIEIGNDYGKSYTLTVNNTTVNGYEINDKGINTGSTLWANKNSMGTDKLKVVVDGVDVY